MLAMAWVTKLLSNPNSPPVVQLIVGISLSTFGVWPGLRVQISLNGTCTS